MMDRSRVIAFPMVQLGSSFAMVLIVKCYGAYCVVLWCLLCSAMVLIV